MIKYINYNILALIMLLKRFYKELVANAARILTVLVI